MIAELEEYNIDSAVIITEEIIKTIEYLCLQTVEAGDFFITKNGFWVLAAVIKNFVLKKKASKNLISNL